MKELERIRGAAWHLSRTYPQLKENIMERLTDVDECWRNLDKKFLERKARLSQAEQVQLYFHDCRELMYVLAPWVWLWALFLVFPIWDFLNYAFGYLTPV